MGIQTPLPQPLLVLNNDDVSWVQPASSKTHWATQILQLFLSSAASCASSQLMLSVSGRYWWPLSSSVA